MVFAVYIKENIMYKRLVQYENDRNLESIWMELNTLDGKLLLYTVYRAPDSNEFWNRLEDNVENIKLSTDMHYMIILGDLNSDFGTIKMVGNYQNFVHILT